MLVLNSLCSWGCPGPSDPPAFIFWVLGLWVCTTTFDFMKLWGLNPGMLECLVRILPTEPHPQPKEKTPHLSRTDTYIFNTLLPTPALLYCSFTRIHWQISAASEWLPWSWLRSGTFLKPQLLPSHPFKIHLVRNSGNYQGFYLLFSLLKM